MDPKTEKQYKELSGKIENWEIDDLVNRTRKILKIEDNEYKIILFCMHLIFSTEMIMKKVLTEIIVGSQKKEMQYPELINLIFDETMFMSKINIMEFIISQGINKNQFNDFFSFCRALNGVRNQIFHTKLEKITYNGQAVSELKTQRKMFQDLINARLKMNI